ncbi:MAG TPA: M20/M25/M40 family metallo-hydrolase [Tepidisphaeraceae bacterium]|nr:M20/M25/M40 family metallo-hydrolase [Tepidisphaeraceae bacterium]
MNTRILTDLTSLPTAPFAEDRVIQYVEAFARARPRIKLTKDSYGNRLLTLPGTARGERWVFVAHMDHPGFVADRMINDRTLAADFRGWVAIEYVRGTKVRFFDGDREITGTVVGAQSTDHNRLAVPGRVTVRVNGAVAKGSPGMFDQGAARIRGKKLFSRGCDDIAGVASALTMLDQLAKVRLKSTVAVLLTRAEEEGFIGAIASVLKPDLIRKDDRLISIECSAMQPITPQGNGVILRVGDKTSIFNSQIMYFLFEQAQALAEKDKTFKYQRALMPGGTCEATVFDAYGYSCGAVCIPLGNYHNMDRAKKKIGPEYIHLDDWRNMVRLFVQIAKDGHKFELGHKPLKKRVEKRFNKLKRFL